MKFRIVGMLLACLLATFSNTGLLIETASGQSIETTDPSSSNAVNSGGSSIEASPRTDSETPESNTIKIPGSTAIAPNGDTVTLPGGIAAGASSNESTGKTDNETAGTSDIKASENLVQGATDTLANEAAEELPDGTENTTGSETTGDSSNNLEGISDTETPDAPSNGTEHPADTEATNQKPEEIQDGNPSDRDVISMVLPVMYDMDDSPLNFIMDPHRQIQKSGPNFEEGETLFFANKDGRYDYSSKSDWLEIINRNDIPIHLAVEAWAWNLSDIHLTQDSSFYGDTTPSIYLALVDTDGNEVPLTSDTNASLDIDIMPGENFYAFAMTGACNPNGNWQEVTESPRVTVTWTVTPLSEILQEEDLQDPEKSEAADEADNSDQEASAAETAESENENESETENAVDEAQTENAADEAQTETETDDTENKAEAELGKQEETTDNSGIVPDHPEDTTAEDSSASRKPANAADIDVTESDDADNPADESGTAVEKPADEIWTGPEESADETETESEAQDNMPDGDEMEPVSPSNESETDIGS